MLDVLWLIPAFPLAGFLLILLFGRRLGEPAVGWLATLMVAASFVVSVGVYIDMLGMPADERSHVEVIFSWIPVGALQVDMAFLADPLSIIMCLFVTGIGALIHLYAIGYMHGDAKYAKFFLYLNLFIAAMLVLVLGENMLVTFLGWEGVGTCSYFLIAFWHTRESAATAGKKAFVTNRVGDWGFMVAMFLTFSAVGSLSFGVLNNNAESSLLSETTATGIAVLLFVGAVGKSAQLPLFIWLPDAMAGPTPVSALIHAATMVTAGVYLMVRVNPVITVAADWVGPTIAWVGVITAFLAATIALAQTDIKRVLAYSTVSQLGFMFLAVGTGAYVAAVFHMITHAVFKALLFLGSGSVIHGMHDEQDMRKMGKLAKFMPITCATFIIGWLAIAGVPPFAGFWSKDEIMLFAGAESPALYVVVYATALLTAIYMTRLVIMTFFGTAKWGSHVDEAEAHELAEGEDAIVQAVEPRGAHGEFKPHESPPIMLIPLVVLGGLAVVAGLMQLPHLGIVPDSLEHRLDSWLEPVVEFGEADISGTWADDHLVLLLFAAVACALVGIVVAWLIYQKRKVKAFEPKLFAEGWYYDKAITWFMGHPGRRGFEGAALFDANVVDGAVTGSAVVVRETANEVRKGETGYVRQYGAVIGIGVVLLLGWFVIVQGILLMLGAETSLNLGFPILTAIVIVPIVGALLVALTPKSRPDYAKMVALLSSVATAALTIWLLASFDTGDAGFQFVSMHTWIEPWGISWHLGVDGISLFLVVLTGLLFPLAIIGIDPHHDERPYLAWLLMLQAGVLGSFLSLDLFVFFIFFEIVLVPMYFLIGGWGYEDRVYAATKFFLFTMFGSAFMLVGLIATVALASRDLGYTTFDLVAIADGANFAASTGRWLFFAFAIAFAVKVPIFPFHTWLPDAHTQAPTAGSVVLAGVMLKLGTYGFLRFGLYLFPEAAYWSRPLWLTLAVIGILYGAVVATMQMDLKRLVAYSSVAHMGFIILGTFAFTTQSLSGGVIQMVNHGVSTGALFLLVGMIYERRSTRKISELKGIQQVAPIFAAGFMLVMLSSIGVPGLNGFVGEFLILIGSFLTARWWTVVAAAGVIFAALYLLWAYQRVFHGEPDDDNKKFREITLKEGAVLLPFLAAIVFMGVYPKPVLDRIEPSIDKLIGHVEDHTDYVEPEPKIEIGVVPEAPTETEHGEEGE